MKLPASGMKIDSPAWPLLQALISYEGVTTANGDAAGLTVVDSQLANEPSYTDHLCKILDGPAAGQTRPVASQSSGTIIVSSPYTNSAGAAAQITAGTRFVLISQVAGTFGIYDLLAASLIHKQAFNTTQTTRNASITLFALDGQGGAKKDIRVKFYLAADAAARFTPAWYVTREGAPVAFTARAIPPIPDINLPAAAAEYLYELGDLPDGAQGEFRVAQDNAGAANVVIDMVATWLGKE